MIFNILLEFLLSSQLATAQTSSNATTTFGSTCYAFPSPSFTRLETLLFEGLTQGGFLLANKVEKCIGIRTVSPIAAEWMRVAFHDIATHDAETGEGGLDYSIAFELDRPENVGPGQIASLEEYRTASNPYYSMSDLIAMAVVFSTVSCSGPYLNYRSGRIDATSAGPSGVPQIEETLDTHINRFKTMGFTQEEMISLTACGHSMGGVRNVDFPQVVNTTGGIDMFDRTRATMDPGVLQEYLQGRSINPLVISSNTTFNSDLRVYSSDGNVTVTRMAESATAFNDICRPLLERFLDTVPSAVQLSEVYDPAPYKVDPVLWAVEDGALTMNVGFRILDAQPDKVTMHWLKPGETEESKASKTTAASPSTITGVVMKAANHSAYRYQFAAKAKEGVGKFWFEYEDEGENVKVDNTQCGGYGYDEEGKEWKVIWDQGKSYSDSNGKMVVAAVHTTVSPESVQVDLWAQSNKIVATTTTVPMTLNETMKEEGSFVFYTAYVPSSTPFNAFTVSATVNGSNWTAESVDSLLIFGGSRNSSSTGGSSGATTLAGMGWHTVLIVVLSFFLGTSKLL